MNEHLRKFLADAQSFSLTEEERSAIRTRLSDECRMIKVTQHLKHAAAGVRLTDVEKAETLGKILKGMRKAQSSSLRQGYSRHAKLKAQSFPGHMWTFMTQRTFAASIASVFLLFAGGGSVAAAAEASIPGDFLYPVKLHVIERVRGRFYRNPEAQDEWRLTRLRRRIHEAETMAKRQNVPPKQWEVMSVSIEQELGEVEREITKPVMAKPQLQQRPEHPPKPRRAEPSVERNEILRERVKDVLREDGKALLKLQRVPEKRKHVRPIVEAIRKHTEILEEIESDLQPQPSPSDRGRAGVGAEEDEPDEEDSDEPDAPKGKDHDVKVKVDVDVKVEKALKNTKKELNKKIDQLDQSELPLP